MQVMSPQVLAFRPSGGLLFSLDLHWEKPAPPLGEAGEGVDRVSGQ